MKLGASGVSIRTDQLSARDAAEVARRVESLGYSAIWLTEGVGRNPLVHAAWLLAATRSLVIATGIANIYLHHPIALSGAQKALAEQSGGRFLLGLGVSHAEMVEPMLARKYDSPIATMTEYLDALDSAPYAGPMPEDPPPVVLAALGPHMLQLAAERTLGAFPVQVTPNYTARARAIMGNDAWLGIKQYVVLEGSASKARQAARERVAGALRFENYRRNLRTLGFSDSDFSDGGSDLLIDSIIAWGDEDSIVNRVHAHRAAGANHVCIEPIHANNPRETDLHALEVLARLLA